MIICFHILIKSRGTRWYKLFSTKSCVWTSSAINNSMWKPVVRTEVTRDIVFVGQMPEGMCEGVRGHTANQCLGYWITVGKALQRSLPNIPSKGCTCSRLCGQLPHTSISWLASHLSSIPTTVYSTESFRFNYLFSLLPAKAQ